MLPSRAADIGGLAEPWRSDEPLESAARRPLQPGSGGRRPYALEPPPTGGRSHNRRTRRLDVCCRQISPLTCRGPSPRARCRPPSRPVRRTVAAGGQPVGRVQVDRPPSAIPFLPSCTWSIAPASEPGSSARARFSPPGAPLRRRVPHAIIIRRARMCEQALEPPC